ncbi:sulfite oxidase cytochrome subunit [Advenella kashmirensis WT001]|uniref:Sulfite oxidase cytochrome subunit n=1 Tax=Advenella kashmirensis (strain DSM 17095 / LMG 22695 / WT001) TaxID=1036672 RepID=I3U742_ADVKW|nr:cytochrome c [Advenella kashmirensis]AFK60830.1 sulfite oxidase cytochrome subunit [Advenella kashmirensis WT001]
MHVLKTPLAGTCAARHAVVLLTCAALLGATAGAAHAEQKFGFGQPVTPEHIAAWDINVFADGRNLPEGSGTVTQGGTIYAQQCAACHGSKGEGGSGDKLVGGIGKLASGKPVKTVGSYWPYAPTLFDYIRRAMPLTAPQSLSNEQVYAVTAYLLHLNGLVEQDARLDAKSLAAIKMPNRDGFVPDPRPDVPQSSGSSKTPSSDKPATPSQ